MFAFISAAARLIRLMQYALAKRLFSGASHPYLRGSGDRRRALFLRKEVIHVSLSPVRGLSEHTGRLERKLLGACALTVSPMGTDNGKAAPETVRPFDYLRAVFFFGARLFAAFFFRVAAPFFAARLRFAFIAGIGLSGA